jgi:hypothetical protein
VLTPAGIQWIQTSRGRLQRVVWDGQALRARALETYGPRTDKTADHYATPRSGGSRVAVYFNASVCSLGGEHGCEAIGLPAEGLRAGHATGPTSALTLTPDCTIGPVGVSYVATGWSECGNYRAVGDGIDNTFSLGDGLSSQGSSLAGAYVVLMDNPAGSPVLANGAPVYSGFTVKDLRTWQTLYEVRTPVVHVAARADGLVVGVSDSNQVFWASPADPTVHPITTLPAGDGSDVKVSGDRIAVASGRLFPGTPSDPAADGEPWFFGHSFAVYDLSGALVAQTRPVAWQSGAAFTTQPDRHWDFDGSSVIWATTPCSRMWIVRWDLSDTPPNKGNTCTWPVLRLDRIRIGRPHDILLPVSCPASSRAGCAGSFGGQVGRSSDQLFSNTTYYDVDPGHTQIVKINLGFAQRTWIGAHRHPSFLRFQIYSDTALHSRLTRRVSVRWPSWIRTYLDPSRHR